MGDWGRVEDTRGRGRRDPELREGPGCPPTTAMKPDDHVSVADSLDAEPDAHGTIVEVGLSTDRELAHSPTATEQIGDQGAGFLVVDPPIVVRSTHCKFWVSKFGSESIFGGFRLVLFCN